MKPLFSIVVPVYNVMPYLKVCLNSLCIAIDRLLIKDSTCGVEIICIDDGSTDESGIILDQYAEENDYFKVVHQCNKGLGPARNNGIEIATGDWILFVDSDDEVTSDYLTVLAEIIVRFAPDAIKFGHVSVERLGNNNASCGGETSCIEAAKEQVAFFKALNSAFAWNVCYRRESIGETRFEPITPGEDVLFSCVMLSRINKVAITSAPIYHYLQRAGSLAHKKNISPLQIESCGISTVQRVACVKKWRYFNAVTYELYKVVRNTYIGQVGLMLHKVSGRNKKAAWEKYCEYGRQLFMIDATYIPCALRHVGQFIFENKSKMLWRVLLFAPWYTRVLLLRTEAVKWIDGIRRRRG